jgi:hypothetical protein
MFKYIPEILEECNKDVTLLENYKTNAGLKFIFEHAFLLEKKFILPEGDPPFKPDAAPIGMTPCNFTQETKKLYVFTAARKDLKALRRETLFIQLLENIHPSEAKVLLAVKDQKLNKLYKNITAKVAAKYGFIPEQVKHEKQDGESAPKKS